MELIYGLSSYRRDRGNFPYLIVRNMFAEEVATEERVVLQSRPGVSATGISMGVAPVKQLFKIDGVLDNQLFGVAGGNLYSSSTPLGAIDGDGSTSIAGYEDFLFVNAGEQLWGYDGTTLGAIAFPDSANVLKVIVAASRALAIREDTGTFYWSDVLADTIDALAFATAENSPDKLKDMLYVGDTLLLFGSETVESWQVTDDDDLPFQPLIGRVFQVGIHSTGTATKFGSTFAWVTNTNEVCLTDPSGVISNPGLQTLIADSVNVSLWTLLLDGIEFLVLRLDDQTWVFNPRSAQWSEFTSHGENNWIAQCHEQGYFGSALDGSIYEWSEEYSDLGGVLDRTFTAWLPIEVGGQIIDNIVLRTNPGQTPFLTGDYDDPSISLRLSMDGGYTYSNWRPRSLGSQGRYRMKIRWTSLGMFGEPGMLAEFRVTAPVPFRVAGLGFNEDYGGV